MTSEIIILSIKKEKNKYIVMTSEGEFSLSEDVLIKYLIVKDKVFSKDLFQEILDEEKLNKLFNKALKFLSFQNRSYEEVRKYLIDKEADLNQTESIIARLESLGYLNDERFAVETLDYMIRTNKGPLFLENRLKEKGISETIINDAVMKYDYYTEQDSIKKVVQKFAEKNKDNPIKRQKMTLYQKLVRDGFHCEVVKEIIDSFNFIDESDEKLDQDIRKLINKYQDKYQGYDLKNRIINNLIQKGYEYTEIVSKLNKDE